MPALTGSAGARACLGAGALIFLLNPAASAESLRDAASRQYYHGELSAAARTLERAIKAAPHEPAAYLDAAVVYRDLDEEARSRHLFEQASRLSPSDPAVHAAHGWAAMRAKRLKEAEDAFLRALKLSMDHPDALIGLAYLQLALNRPKAALATAQRLTGVRPDMTLGYVLAGRAQKALGRKSKAIEAFTAAFKSDNTYSEVRLWLGPLYAELKRYNAAWRQYARVLYVSPSHAGALAAKRRLSSRITRAPKELIPPVRQMGHLSVHASKSDPETPLIRVAVGTTIGGNPAPKTVVAFVCDGPFEVTDPETGKRLFSGPADKVWKAERVRAGKGHAYRITDEKGRRRAQFQKVLSVRPRNPKRHSLLFQRLNIAGGTVWEFTGDRQLKGEVELRALGSRGLYLVNVLGLEDYTYGVINEEMPRRYPLEALKAQAVIARNHALQSKSYKLHSRDHYDLCDGQHCQVFSGVSGESKIGRKAVDATRGEVLRYKGRLAHTPYSSNCGGHTQDSGEVSGWTKFPFLSGREDDEAGEARMKSPWELERWLKTRPDVFCNVPEYMHPAQFRWSRIISASELGDRIRRRDKGFGYLRRIRILKRSVSGNVNKIEFIGTRGRYVVSREQRIRGMLGVGSARSTMFLLEIERNGDGIPTDIFVYGGGWGHGIGLCQIGAAGRGAKGQTYRQILTHYYKGTEIGSLGYR